MTHTFANRLGLTLFILFLSLTRSISAYANTNQTLDQPQNLCEAELSVLHHNLAQARLSRDGFAVLNSVAPLTAQEIVSLVNELRRHWSRELAHNESEIFNLDPQAVMSELQSGIESQATLQTRVGRTPSIQLTRQALRPWLRYVRDTLNEISKGLRPEEGTLTISSLQLRYSPGAMTAENDEEGEKVWIHQDGGYLAVTSTWRGVSTFLLDEAGQPYPVPSGLPLVFTAKQRAEALPNLASATWHGQPKNFAGERLLMVMRLEPVAHPTEHSW